MKRASKLYEKLISTENLSKAIEEVNRTHHWRKNHQPNTCTAWVEETKQDRIIELRKIIDDGFVQQDPHTSRRWDVSAQKWRNINEPIQWPDQYIHHALIQILQPVMMRGMDYYCCGSIRGKGPKQAKKAIEGWVRSDIPSTKYELCGDVYHFYDSLKPEIVMDRMKKLVKDHRILDLIWRIIKDGVKIGFYSSQWFANTVLQPLDQLIRQSGFCKYYTRYMDNLTIFGPNKRKLRKLRVLIEEWLNAHNLKLKSDWQIFPVAKKTERIQLGEPRNGVKRSIARIPCAVGFRYGRDYTLLRKHIFLRLKRAVARYRKLQENGGYISPKMAAGIISRLGQLKHCSNYNIYRILLKGERIESALKKIVRDYQKTEELTWSMYLEQRKVRRSLKQKAVATAS